MSKRIGIAILLIIVITIAIIFVFKFQNRKSESRNLETETAEVISNSKKEDKNKGVLNSVEDIDLQDTDGKEKNYTFEYKGDTYKAVYTTDNWKIIDSYKIRNKNDIAVICEALIEVHPIHGRDMQSYRTVEDLVYEWTQHNYAYDLLPAENDWKSHAKDVDLNPEDQGKNLQELYKARMYKE